MKMFEIDIGNLSKAARKSIGVDEARIKADIKRDLNRITPEQINERGKLGPVKSDEVIGQLPLDLKRLFYVFQNSMLLTARIAEELGLDMTDRMSIAEFAGKMQVLPHTKENTQKVGALLGAIHVAVTLQKWVWSEIDKHLGIAHGDMEIGVGYDYNVYRLKGKDGAAAEPFMSKKMGVA